MVGDIAALASLINLQHLDISNCENMIGKSQEICSIVRCCVVGDITALATLVNLQHLTISASYDMTGE